MTRSPWFVRTVLVLLALLILLARYRTLHEPLERDLMVYAVIGHELLEGRALYSDLWDHKPSAIHLSYALAEYLAGYGPLSIYALNVTLAILTMLGIYFAASREPGDAGVGLLAATYWALCSGDLALQANQPNTELFLNACLAWVFALFVRRDGGRLSWRDSLTIGLLFALASHYKPIVVFSAASLTLTHLWLTHRPERRRAVLQVLGVALVGGLSWIGTAIWFASRGGLSDWYHAVFSYNRAYAGGLSRNMVRGLLPHHLVPSTLYDVLPVFVVAIVGLLVARERGRGWWLWLAYAAGSLMSIAAPGQFWPHYYQLWLPVMTIGAAWAVAELRARFEQVTTRNAIYLTTGLGLACVLFALQFPNYRLDAQDWSQRKYGSIFVDTKQAAWTIGLLLEPTETFYEWGAEPGLYYEARRSPPTGAFYNLPLLSGPLATELSGRVMRELAVAPPELVIVNLNSEAPPDHPVVAFIERYYKDLPGNWTTGPFQFRCLKGGRLDKRPDPFSFDRK